MYTRNAGRGVSETEVMLCGLQDCQSPTLLLNSMKLEACFRILVADDRDIEIVQNFEISLTTAQPRVVISNAVTVDVIDDDGTDIDSVLHAQTITIVYILY